MDTLADFRLPAGARRTVAALVPIVCTEEALELRAVEGVVEQVELFLRAVPPHVRVALLAALAAFEHSSRLWPATLGRPFSRLPRSRARAHFARLWDSDLGPLHTLAQTIKMVVAFGYYELPQVKERLGYRPEEWITAAARRREERFGAEVRRHEELALAPDPLLPPVPAPPGLTPSRAPVAARTPEPHVEPTT